MSAQSESRHWRPMSPEEIRNAPLRESGLGRRGYRPEDVDHLRHHLAQEVEHWAHAYGDAQAEVSRLREYYRTQGVELDQSRREQSGVSPEAVAIMARAQAYADQVVADAQAQARHVAADARAQAEVIIAQSRRDADQAGHAYRARVGHAYSADREETERLAAWARSILASVQAVQHQLAVTAEAFSMEIARFGPPPQAPSHPPRDAAPETPLLGR
jgi:cell division septum initiation protein DivIVA